MKKLLMNKRFFAVVLVLMLIVAGLAIVKTLTKSDMRTEAQLNYAHMKFNQFFNENKYSDSEDNLFEVSHYEYLQFGKTYELSPGIEVVFNEVRTVKTVNSNRNIVFYCSVKNTTDEDFNMPADNAFRCGMLKNTGGSSVTTMDGGYWRENGKEDAVLQPGEEKELTFSEDSISVSESYMKSCEETYGYVIGFCAVKIQDTAYYLDFFDSVFEWNSENYSNNLQYIIPNDNENAAENFEELELGKTYLLEDNLDIVINDIKATCSEDGFVELHYYWTLTNLTDKDNFIQETFNNNGWVSVNDGNNGGIDECTLGNLLKVTSEDGKRIGYVKPNESIDGVIKAENLVEREILNASAKNNGAVTGYYLIVLGDTGCWIDLNSDYILNLI